MKTLPMSAKGFTLLELLVVMVIIGMLAAYVGPKYFGQIGKSEVTTTQNQMAALRKALDLYRLDVGSYPTSTQGLRALVTRPDNEPKWRGPYMSDAVPNDAWGHPFQYRSPGVQREYDLVSWGQDQKAGGEGLAADLLTGPP